MQPNDPPGAPIQRAPGGWRWALTAGVALNVGLAAWLLFSQAQLNRRLDRLEGNAPAESTSRGRVSGEPSADGRPSKANRTERVALLLAMSGDAEASRRMLESLPPGEISEIARVLIARPAANDRNAALVVVLRKITEDDPSQAIALLDSVPEAGFKSDLAARIAATWIEHDPASAAAWLAGDGARFFARQPLSRFLAGAASRWAAFDPAAAARFVAANPLEDDTDAQVLRTVSREWARKDPAAALAWTQSLPAADPRKPPATYGVLEGWSEVNPAQAAGYVGQISFSPNASYAGEAAAVAARWTQGDPVAAAQWALNLSDRRARRDALQQVAATWSASDTPGAARWAATLPPGRERAEIWQGIVEYWVGTDPTATEAWLNTLPMGDRDGPVAAYAAKIVPANPEKALAWARTLGDGAFATQQVQTLLAAWSRRDATAARNWAAANQFSPASSVPGR